MPICLSGRASASRPSHGLGCLKKALLNVPGVGVEIDCQPYPACQRNLPAVAFAQMDCQVHGTSNREPELGDQ